MAIRHAIPISVKVVGKFAAQSASFFEGVSATVVASERKFQQCAVVDVPKIGMHLLVQINSGRDMQDLVQLDHVDQIRPFRVVWFHELLRIERFANKNVQHLARARQSFANDLRVVKIEFGFAAIPVAAVLQKCRSELSGRAFEQRKKN